MTKSVAYFGMFLGLMASVLFSCSDNEGRASGSGKFEFEIIDSLAIDYIGSLELSDISPDGKKFLLIDRQRNSVLIVDNKSEILHEWTKSIDGPDGHGRLSRNPVFAGNDRIVLEGSRGWFFYDLEGNIVKQIREFEYPSGGLFISTSQRSIVSTVGGKERIIGASNWDMLFGKPESPDQARSVFIIRPELDGELYIPDEFKGKESKFMTFNVNPAFKYAVGFEPSSYSAQYFEYLDALDWLTSISMKDNQLALLFRNDPFVYLYDWDGENISFLERIELTPDELHIDDPTKWEPSFIEGPGGIKVPMSKGQSIGEGSYQFVHLSDALMITYYNSGVKKELRVKPELKQEGDGIFRIVTEGQPDPKMMFQVFQNGKKLGSDFEKPSKFKTPLFGKGDQLWFSRDAANDEEESDFIIFYRTKLTER